MGQPGVVIVPRTAPQPRTAPVDTGTLFAVGITEKGPEVPLKPITSLDEFNTRYGARLTTSSMYDALETFFREGGGRAYIGRVLGPAKATAGRTLNDAGAAPVLRVDANSPGAWGNSLLVQVTAGDTGGEFKLVISHSTLGTLESSPSLVDTAAAVSWGSGSGYVVISLAGAGANDPAVAAAQALTGGADDTAGILDAHWLTALSGMAKALGPGQVCAPGRSTLVGHQQLLAHAKASNRFALLDPSDTTSSATLIGFTNALKTSADARYGMLVGPWLNIPGLTPGTTRAVPASAGWAGLIARSEALGNTPNAPAAGENGRFLFAVGPRATFDDATLLLLNNAGVNISKPVYGGLRAYGWRSLVDPNGTLRTWLPAGNGRLYMAIAARLDATGESYVLREIDGRGRTISQFGAALVGDLIPYYDAGSLYGETPEEAFNVDVGPTVNTPATIAALQLRAVVIVRMAPMGEEVVIEIAKVGVTESVG
jgi:predicted RNA-binding protein with TRAM domain